MAARKQVRLYVILLQGKCVCFCTTDYDKHTFPVKWILICCRSRWASKRKVFFLSVVTFLIFFNFEGSIAPFCHLQWNDSHWIWKYLLHRSNINVKIVYTVSESKNTHQWYETAVSTLAQTSRTFGFREMSILTSSNKIMQSYTTNIHSCYTVKPVYNDHPEAAWKVVSKRLLPDTGCF